MNAVLLPHVPPIVYVTSSPSWISDLEHCIEVLVGCTHEIPYRKWVDPPIDP